MIRYLTMAESIKLNGERHLANAVGYASRGLFSHSDGSMRKAVRNFNRADDLEMPLSPFTRRITDRVTSDFVKRIADRIMGY